MDEEKFAATTQMVKERQVGRVKAVTGSNEITAPVCTVCPQLFALNCLLLSTVSPASTVRPQLFALNCSPSTVCPQLFALNCLPSN